MNKEKKLYKNKKQNLIILTKEGVNEAKQNKINRINSIKSGTILTLKGEDFVVKKNLLNSNDINKEKILKTVISMKNNLIYSESETIIQNDNIKYNNIFNPNTKNQKILIDSKDTEKLSDYDLILQFNDKININKNITKKKKEESENTMKASYKAMICKTNSENDKITELGNKKKLFTSKFGVKSSVNEVDVIENNNISVYEYVNFNNENIKVKDISNYNDSNYSKVINTNNRKNNFILNINKNDKNNKIGNIMLSKNNLFNYQTSLNENIKKPSNFSDISGSLKKNIIQNIYNENIINDNISENKKLIVIHHQKKIINSSNLDSIKINQIINKKESEKKELKPINNNINNNLIEAKDGLNKKIEENKKIFCFICEKSYNLNKMFSPKCNAHYICRKCIKSYYEDIFENNNFLLKCPKTNCNEEIELNILKNIISQTHYEMFINMQKKNKEKFNSINSFNNNIRELYLKDTKLLFNSKIKNENIKLYSQNHVLDINSNEKLYLYNKNKDIYCQKCFKPTLFTKINGFFIKCLNCDNKICKYCLKEFNNYHMDIMYENHCKVYYRKDDDFYFNNTSKILVYLLQLFYVLAMYYLSFAGIFYIVLNFLQKIIKFSYRKYNNKCILFIIYIFFYFFSFIALLACSPFIVVIHPFFPSILSLIDY